MWSNKSAQSGKRTIHISFIHNSPNWNQPKCPSVGKIHGEGNGTPLQYYCLENPMDRGAWWAAVHGVAKSWT